MSTKRTISTLAAATAVALAAIGPASASARTDGGAVPASAKKDIVDTAVAAGNFDTLAALLKQAGLVKTLKGKGPYTVFAPADKAFAKVPKATLDTLAKDKAKLRSVLLYHVAKGKLTASKVVKRRRSRRSMASASASASATARCSSAAHASPRPTSPPPTASSTSSTRS